MNNNKNYQAKFVQFPLCLLQYGFCKDNHIDRLHSILSFGFKRIAAHFDDTPIKNENYAYAIQVTSEKELHNDETVSRIEATAYAATIAADKGKLPPDMNINNIQHLQMWQAAKKSNVIINSMEKALNDIQKAENYVNHWHAKTGKQDTQTRCGIGLIFDCIKGTLSYRQFAVICAISAKIGTNPVRIIRSQDIHAATHGFRSKKLLDEYSGDPTFCSNILFSLDQIKRTTTELCEEKLNFFRRYTHGKRNSYYSYKLSGSEFVNYMSKLLDSKAERKAKAHVTNTAIERKTAALKAEREAAQNKPQVINLITGEKLYSLEFLSIDNPPVELAAALTGAVEIEWRGMKYYCFSKISSDKLKGLLTVTLKDNPNII